MASESRVAAIESWISVYLTVHRPLDADAIGHSEFARVIEFRDLDFFYSDFFYFLFRVKMHEGVLYYQQS